MVAASAEEIARTFLKGPYLQAPGADSMSIMWESPTDRPGLVRYGLKGRLDRVLRLETPRQLNGVWPTWTTNVAANGTTNVTEVSNTNIVFLYEMTLTNLRPNSIYSYAAETDGVRTPPRKFKTFGAHPREVRFIAYGDTRTNPKMHAAIAANFKRHSPDFILHTGSIIFITSICRARSSGIPTMSVRCMCSRSITATSRRRRNSSRSRDGICWPQRHRGKW